MTGGHPAVGARFLSGEIQLVHFVKPAVIVLSGNPGIPILRNVNSWGRFPPLSLIYFTSISLYLSFQQHFHIPPRFSSSTFFKFHIFRNRFSMVSYNFMLFNSFQPSRSSSEVLRPHRPPSLPPSLPECEGGGVVLIPFHKRRPCLSNIIFWQRKSSFLTLLSSFVFFRGRGRGSNYTVGVIENLSE